MTEKFGIENMKKLLALVIEIGNVIDKMVGTPGLAKLGHLMMLMDEAMALATVDWKLLDDEYKDFSAVEKEEINAFLEAKFDISNDKIEEVVERSWRLFMRTESIIHDVLGLVKFVKA